MHLCAEAPTLDVCVANAGGLLVECAKPGVANDTYPCWAVQNMSSISFMWAMGKRFSGLAALACCPKTTDTFFMTSEPGLAGDAFGFAHGFAGPVRAAVVVRDLGLVGDDVVRPSVPGDPGVGDPDVGDPDVVDAVRHRVVRHGVSSSVSGARRPLARPGSPTRTCLPAPGACGSSCPPGGSSGGSASRSSTARPSTRS